MSDLDDAFRWQEIQNAAAMQRARNEREEVESMRAELQRFRTREPLVQELIERIALDEDPDEVYLAMDRLRDRTRMMRITGASENASSADDLTGSDQAAALKSLEKLSRDR